MPSAGRHGAGIGIGQGDLPVGRIGQDLVQCFQPRNLLPDTAITASEMGDLVSPDFALFLAVDTGHVIDILRDIGLQMGQAAGNLVLRKVPVAIVHRLEFAAVDGHTSTPTQLHELRAGPAYRRPVISPEIGDGLVVGRQAAEQPHQLDITARFALQATAERDAVQIAVDERLQQHSRVAARATGSGEHTTLEAERQKIELLDEGIDDTDQVILADPVLETIGEKRDLV